MDLYRLYLVPAGIYVGTWWSYGIREVDGIALLSPLSSKINMAAKRGKVIEGAFAIDEQWKENDLDFKKFELFNYWNNFTLFHNLPW